ncbi:tetratricopeptide repeat protein [Parasedimentitalea psychrophila]|uniref:Tetratricopeptide repeat protein n=1 Tax=Parasedimentitalea psychrophila TaxID=2997337 RepID=A0A9Y2KZY4_9RHOB|nr:tetratricopeptide repeat protein [Parasedimentitalea psychrophila]WIY25524.1 tetratricopeptide repeat protein [Parasedimentitalea psychrophila]
MLGDNTDNTIHNGSGNTQARDIHGISPEQFERQLNKSLVDLRADLEAKHAETRRADAAELKMRQMEISDLQRQIGDYEARVANPEAAYKEHIARIAELEQLLRDATVEIGENRIKDAQAALEQGDFSKADEIFAEVEEFETQAVKRASKASFGRGLIAEEQVRWQDAAEHYSRAARLDPSYETLIKAGHFLGRSGLYAEAIRIEEQLLQVAMKEFGDEHKNTAIALNNLAANYKETERYGEAEPLYRKALEIDRKVLGTDHPDYAIRLNNLAALLEATGRYGEAEPLYLEALEVDRKVLGIEHPDYAIHLSNFAGLLVRTGRPEDAEPMYRKALLVFETALGMEHPHTVQSRGLLEGFLTDHPN